MGETGAVQIWRGGVNAWECDEMGHMNVRFYIARAQEGLAGMALHLGQPCAFAPNAAATLLVREHRIRFNGEARAGAPLHMTGAVVEMDETEATLLQLLTHSETGEPCASFLTRVVHATPTDGRRFPWPERSREAAARLGTTVPPFAQSRGIPTAFEGAASRERADALAMACTSYGAIAADACDVFGRMNADRFTARMSDGTGRTLRPMRALLGRAAPDIRMGVAALEYRLVYNDLPRAGDHVELRSGLASVGKNVQQIVHWMLDPASGQVWATGQVLVANFDLDARKIIALPPDLRASLAGQITPGLLA